jgi:TolB-like protein/DNA-binding winged helix-turn-helix (wHTH) protein/Flp pilus assembly protein TadD
MTQRFRFGDDFELDPGAYQLQRAGQALKLERIPFEILLALIEHRGQMLSREQIAERIWGKGHFLDIDNSINGAIRKIRQVLHDDSEHPHFIQTITGRGYRFIAPVVAVEAPADAVVAAAARPERRRVWASAAAAVVLLLAVVAWLVVRGSQPSGPTVMVAVLPFENLTGDAAQEYFSDGLTEEMITQLGTIDPRRLQVIARTSVMHYRTRQATLEEIARELKVQYVLEGSVRRDANAVRVTAQLIQTRDQTHIWAEQYDRELKDLLALQREVAQRIATEIQSTLGVGAPAAPSAPARATEDYAAYDLYLKGLHFFNKRTVPDLERAIEFLEQATVRDPNYARAHALLAGSYALLNAYSGLPPGPLVPKARAAAHRALQLDPGSAEAHAALAWIVGNHDWDWQRAEREFRRAIELNPNYATAHHWYSELLMCLGRFDEALRESDIARQLDPLSLIIATDHGAILINARQYDRAAEILQSVRDRDPDFPRAHMIWSAWVETGRLAEALADLESISQVRTAGYWAARAILLARGGDAAEAREAIRELQRYSDQPNLWPEIFAGPYAVVGERDKAFEWLERAYAQRWGLTSLKVNPYYDSLRGDLRYENLLRRVGLSP